MLIEQLHYYKSNRYAMFPYVDRCLSFGWSEFWLKPLRVKAWGFINYNKIVASNSCPRAEQIIFLCLFNIL